MLLMFYYRSLPKLSNPEEDAGRAPQGGVVTFEPIQHDHDFCERVVINVSGYTFGIYFSKNSVWIPSGSMFKYNGIPAP